MIEKMKMKMKMKRISGESAEEDQLTELIVVVITTRVRGSYDKRGCTAITALYNIES